MAFISTCGFSELPTCLPAALALDGAVVVTDVPGIGPAREAALRHLFSCAAKNPDQLVETLLQDGTRRLSAGTRMLHGAADGVPECAGLGEAADPLRAVVDLAYQRVLRVLEPLVRVRGEVLPASGGTWYKSLSDVAHGGEQLEHFHAYLPTPPPLDVSRPGRSAEDDPTAIPLHTDGGLFIAMIPALYARPTGVDGVMEAVHNYDSNTGFFVERADGSVASVPPEVESSSVVFALGDGWKQWINPKLRTPLRAAPHAMSMPRRTSKTATPDSIVRLWYGRMFLPPGDSLLPPHGITFAAHRSAESVLAGVHHDVLASSRELSAAVAALPSGCAGGRRFLQSANSCGSNKIFCWHQCV